MLKNKEDNVWLMKNGMLGKLSLYIHWVGMRADIKDNDGQGKQPKFETERSKFLFCKMCLKVIRDHSHVTSTQFWHI